MTCSIVRTMVVLDLKPISDAHTAVISISCSSSWCISGTAVQRMVVFFVMGARFSNFLRLSVLFACYLASRSLSWRSAMAVVSDPILVMSVSVLGFPGSGAGVAGGWLSGVDRRAEC